MLRLNESTKWYCACIELVHVCSSTFENTLKAVRPRLCARRSRTRKVKNTGPWCCHCFGLHTWVHTGKNERNKQLNDRGVSSPSVKERIGWTQGSNCASLSSRGSWCWVSAGGRARPLHITHWAFSSQPQRGATDLWTWQREWQAQKIVTRDCTKE